MECKVARFQSGGGMHLGLGVRGELAGGGIKSKLVDGVGAGVGNVGVAIGGSGEDGVCAAFGLNSAEGIFFNGTIMCDGMGADFASTVAGPEESAAGAIGGHVCGVGPDVGNAKWLEGFFVMIDAESGDTVFVADSDVEAVAIGAEALGTGRAGQVNFGAFSEGTLGWIKIV